MFRYAPPKEITIMPDIMNEDSLFNFDGAKAGDVLLSRTFELLPRNGVDLDNLESISAEVYHVVRLVKDEDDQTIDLAIERLEYRNRVAEADDPCYYLYGGKVVKENTSPADTEKDLLSFREQMSSIPRHFVSNRIDPCGWAIREHIFDYACPENCDCGWLRDQRALEPLMDKGEMPAIMPFTPLCPACFGKDTVKMQMALRAPLDHDDRPFLHDFQLFQSRVIERWNSLGYCGMCTCSICLLPLPRYPTPRTHAEAERAYWGVIEYDATTVREDRPASEAAIAALPRKHYHEKSMEETKCAVCQEDFDSETEVAELPCKHILCAKVCIDWLRHEASCPVCRYRIASASVVKEDFNAELPWSGVGEDRGESTDGWNHSRGFTPDGLDEDQRRSSVGDGWGEATGDLDDMHGSAPERLDEGLGEAIVEHDPDDASFPTFRVVNWGYTGALFYGEVYAR